MSGPARWLPLSLLVHATTLAGGVWLVRDVGMGARALFVDMTLRESPADSPGPTFTERRAAAPAPAKPAGPTPVRRVAAPAASAAPAPAPTPQSAAAPPIPSPSPVASPSPAASASGVIDAPPTAPGASDTVPPSAAPGGSGGVGSTGNAGAVGASDAMSAALGPRDGGGGDGMLALAIPGDGGAGTYGPYLSALRRRLQQALEYPSAARRRGLSGTVHLEIALEATGRVSEVLLVRSSSHAVLDDAALDAARGLRRVPFPADVRPRALRVRLPVVFDLR